MIDNEVKTPSQTITQKIGNYRWRICAPLFAATTINYIDRQIMSLVLIDEGFKRDIPLNPAKIGYVDAAFKAAYTIGFLIVGNFIDRIGTRKGFSYAVVVWSLAAMAHALTRTPIGFALARFRLGLGESGNFPGAVKTVAEWFPKSERSYATGIFNSGSNIGVILAGIGVPFITLNYGWQWAFIVSGAIGFLWLVAWLAIYRRPEEHPRLSEAERAYILSDPAEPTDHIPWRKLLTYRQIWAVVASKIFTDPVWWFYLTWLPLFFNTSQNFTTKLDLKSITLPILVIYLVSDVGSIAGGWLATYLIKKGWSVNKARKTTMLICGLCVVPIFFASQTHNIWVAIMLCALATAGHQGWSANAYTLASDMFPKRVIASVIGIGGFSGALSGTIFAAASGLIIQHFKYWPLFAYGSTAYLIGIIVIHLIAPRLEPVKVD